MSKQVYTKLIDVNEIFIFPLIKISNILVNITWEMNKALHLIKSFSFWNRLRQLYTLTCNNSFMISILMRQRIRGREREIISFLLEIICISNRAKNGYCYWSYTLLAPNECDWCWISFENKNESKGIERKRERDWEKKRCASI
jgi:hypothetical protein